jgi:dTDP-4-amino-4,6-dideoxygalactose transaminase
MVNVLGIKNKASSISMTSVQVNDESMQAVLNVLKSGQLAQGPKVEQFEKAFADYIGTNYAIAVNSGTAALHVGLLAAGIVRGDEVITTPFSFVATANCCLFCGAVPVFVDIDDETFDIAPHLIEKKITPKTKAIIIVDLYGQPCDMDEILTICKKHNLVLIEDACQAHGAEYGGRKVGSFGIGCFSFYPTKNMTTGEGGMITTDDEDIARKARMIRQHGQSQRYVNDLLGYNFRMTDIAAALGICQLKNLDIANTKRIKNAKYLSEHISQIKGLIPPYNAPNRKHVFHQYTIKVTDDYRLSRDELQQRLNDKRIGSNVYYPIPIHKQPLYKSLGYNDSLPASEEVAKKVLSLPVHPDLDGEDLKKIVEALNGSKKY